MRGAPSVLILWKEFTVIAQVKLWIGGNSRVMNAFLLRDRSYSWLSLFSVRNSLGIVSIVAGFLRITRNDPFLHPRWLRSLCLLVNLSGILPVPYLVAVMGLKVLPYSHPSQDQGSIRSPSSAPFLLPYFPSI